MKKKYLSYSLSKGCSVNHIDVNTSKTGSIKLRLELIDRKTRFKMSSFRLKIKQRSVAPFKISLSLVQFSLAVFKLTTANQWGQVNQK